MQPPLLFDQNAPIQIDKTVIVLYNTIKMKINLYKPGDVL